MSIPLSPIGFRLAHELKGLLSGIQADGRITEGEVGRLSRWLAAAAPYRDIRPFAEIVVHLDAALADGILEQEEVEDLLFITAKYTTVNPYFDGLRSGLQTLMGVLNGMAADQSIDGAEAKALSSWLDEWSHLKGLWPYDECESIVTNVLLSRDASAATSFLLALANQFPVAGQVESENPPPVLIGGVCALDPGLQFEGREFVFTGESARGERRILEARVRERAGVPSPRLTKETDYLVVCDGGNPHWAFACYGRKVERAYQQRRNGQKVVIVHERDFWDALIE